MLLIKHNSQDKFYREPFGAVECGQKVILRLLVKSENSIKGVKLRIWQNNSEMLLDMEKGSLTKDGYLVFECAFVPSEKPQLVWYYFIIEEHGTLFYCNNREFLGGMGEMCGHPTHSYQITVYKKGFETPNWLKNGVMYQIFTDRFYRPIGSKINKKREEYLIHENWDDIPEYERRDELGDPPSNDFFGGNLKGIIEKLPYLQDLGITIIYLNPIFDAYSNHKYDTGDYSKIDPMFGDNKTFKLLCEKAEEHGISIILDGVFSHTGSDSSYFNKKSTYKSLGAYQSMESPYYSWYRFSKHPDTYESWWGVKTLPNVNEMNESYMDYIINSKNSIIKRWIKAGAKGWRLDVADELPDAFIKKLRIAAKSANPDATVIGEVWEDASNKQSYSILREYLMGDELDSVMNYPFRDALINYITNIWDAQKLNKVLMSLYENYPKECFYALMNLVGTHDVPRIRTLLGDTPNQYDLQMKQRAEFKMADWQMDLSKRRVKLAVLFQMTFPGVPCVYYGDEAGMQGYRDPFNRACYPWGREDKELIEWYKLLIGIRNSYDVLKSGEFMPIYAHEMSYCFMRKYQNETLLVFMNTDKYNKARFSVDLREYNIQNLVDLVSKEIVNAPKGKLEIEVESLSGMVLMATDINLNV